MENDQLDQQLLDAVANSLGPYVAGLATKEKHRIFSGVFVKYANRWFVATAAHCVADLARPTELYVISRRRPLETGPSPVAGVGHFKDDVHDIGVVEIPPDFVPALDAKWLDLTNASSKEARPGMAVCLYGWPQELCTTEYEAPLITNSRPMFVATAITRRQPSSDIRRCVRDEIDLLVEFPDTPCRTTGFAPESLQGMSGCGVWKLPLSRDGELWSPNPTRLLGLQVSEFARSRFIKFQRVEWVRSALDHYLRYAEAEDPDYSG